MKFYLGSGFGDLGLRKMPFGESVRDEIWMCVCVCVCVCVFCGGICEWPLWC